jgi:hypothetical protein
MNSHQGKYFLERIVRRTLAMSLQSAIVILITLVTVKGFGQTYQFSTPINGSMDLYFASSTSGGSGFSSVSFSTLAETIIYDPVNLTLRQMGYITLNNSDATTTGNLSDQAGNQGAVKVQQHIVGGIISFDSGLVAYNSPTYQYFSSFRDAVNTPNQINGSYSLNTGGQTYTGDFSPTLSFNYIFINPGNLPYYNIALNSDSTSLTLSGSGSSSGQIGAEFDNGNLEDGNPTVTAINGLSMTLYSGSDGDSFHVFSLTAPDSIIATEVPEPGCNSILCFGALVSALPVAIRKIKKSICMSKSSVP